LNVFAVTILNVTPSSGVPGTPVTISGSGFGAAQGNGQVWLGTANGVVQSWSDTQVVAAVATGSATGNASVLQNGVISNAVPFTLNSLHLAGVSPASGAAGTVVTFTGTGFGDSQGSGGVWLGSTDGQVVSWSDTQIVAAVATGALTGIARVQQNGVWSNAVTFSVPGPGGLQLEPALINMVVGDTHPMQTVNAAGQRVSELTWASSDTTVVSLSTDDPPVLTAVAAGHVTITAGTASADVTVWATALPVGTVLWSNPGDGSGVTSIVPAVPSGYGVAHVFALQGDGTVQAITGYGTTAWTAAASPMGTAAASPMGRAAVPRMRPAGRYRQPAGRYRPTADQDQQPAVVVPDFRGGLVMMASNSIVGLDGMTGQPKFTYALPNQSQCEPISPSTVLAVHPDGTIFTLGCDGYNPLILGIDGSTGALKFSVPVTVVGYNWDWYGMIIAGDGYAYAAYGYADNIQGTPCTGMDSHLKLLRIDSSGNYNNIDVVNVHTSDCNVDGWLPFGANMITNADQGIMFTWGDWYGNSFIAVTTGASVSVMSAPMAPTPVLQAQDGSFFGTVTTWDGSYVFNIVSFDIAGNVRWMVPMTNPFPQIATADGGLIVNDYDGTAWTAITFDKDGNATGQMGSLPTYSWWGYAYEDGPVTQVVADAPFAAASWWAFWLATDSANSTAQRPWFVGLVDCQSPNAECRQHGWTKATGGPNEWIHNGLKSLLTLLATPCDPNGTLWAQQACNIDKYVFTSKLKDANGKQGTRADFAAYLRGAPPLNSQYPSFYDGLRSYLQVCDWTAPDGCRKNWTQHDEFSAKYPPDAVTIVFDKRTPPKILRMRTFFRSAYIFPELLGVAEPNNMALVFHEALHAYTRLPDQGPILNYSSAASLKNDLGCTWSLLGDTYDITAFLLQFTTLTTQQLSDPPQPCSYFAGEGAPPDPQQ
jgi:hypothetical protein